MKKKISFLMLRLSVAIFIIVYILRMVDLRRVWEILSGIDFRYSIALLLLSILSVFVSTYRWSTLLTPLGLEVPLKKLLSFFMIGNFFNSIMPSAIGGDVMRVYELGTYSSRRIESLSSVLIDRLTGLWASSSVAVVSLCFSGVLVKKSISCVVLGFSGFFVISGFCVFSEKTKTALISVIAFLRLGSFGAHFIRHISSVQQYKFHKKCLLGAFSLSLIIRSLGVIIVYVLSLSMGWSVSIWYFFVFMPLIVILTSVPISLNGIGVREGAFVYFFSTIHISPTDAMALSFLTFLWIMLFSIFGALWYIFGR